MRYAWMLGAAAAAIAGPALAAPSVEIKDAALRVVVIPEARSDVKVQVLSTNSALPIYVRQIGDRVVVHGGLRHRFDGCSIMFGKPTVHVRGLGQVSYDNLPQIVVRTPMDVHVGAGEAVFGSISRAESVSLANAGCGDWTIGNVRGELRISEAGSGDVRAGAMGALLVRVAGSGDVFTRDIAGPADLDMAGAGDVTVGSISGPLHAKIAGSGDIKINGGHASEMTVRIAGSGDVRFGGVADSLTATIAGSGDVNVAKVTGPVRKTIFGSGDVNVGQ